MKYKLFPCILLYNIIFLPFSKKENTSAVKEVDICIYGGTSAGVVAAYSAKKMGKSVLLVEPGKYLGGMTTGGLGMMISETNMQLPDWHAFSIVVLESIIINSSNGLFPKCRDCNHEPLCERCRFGCPVLSSHNRCSSSE